MRRLRLSLLTLALLGAGCGAGENSGDPDVRRGGPDVPGFDAVENDSGRSDFDAAREDDASVGEDAGTRDAPASDARADADLRRCPDPPACDAAPPDPGPRQSWRHSIASRWVTSQGNPHHRGRDLFLREGETQWAIAKFAYGWGDDDLEDENVDIYLLRDCRTWERLGTALTTDDDNAPHPPVEGVEDSGGRVYFRIPEARRLGVGHHRLHFVVRGDLSTTDAYINVLPAGARVAVSDVDGTLTESENAEFRTLLGGSSPMANPGSPEALWALARRGYHLFYLTARPEWLAPRTHEWLVERRFPHGVVHTTLGLTGERGDAAQTFKTNELLALNRRVGHAPDWAFGNTPTDVNAYHAAGIEPSRQYYYRYDGDLRGGNRLEDYSALVEPFRMLSAVCPAP